MYEKNHKCNPRRSAKDGKASDCWSKAHKKNTVAQPDIACPCGEADTTNKCIICKPVGFHSPRCSCDTVKAVLPSLSKEQGRV